jgi:molybdopterin/thiamine biosynthesis adenylyltransferase
MGSILEERYAKQVLFRPIGREGQAKIAVARQR